MVAKVTDRVWELEDTIKSLNNPVQKGGEAKMSKKPERRLAGRSAVTGRLESVERARSHPRTSVVERLPCSPGL